jgi:hypothetical protein
LTLHQTGKLEVVRRELLYFYGVLFQVLPVALQYVDADSKVVKLLRLNSYDAVDCQSPKYNRRGLSIMKLLGRHSPTVMSVEADLLASFFLKNSSNATEAWFVLGDAIRQAQGLELHLRNEIPHYEDNQTRNEAIWYNQHKRRLMAHLFNWDAHTALIMGPPRTINETDCTPHLPIDCNMPEDLPNITLDDPSLQVP